MKHPNEDLTALLDGALAPERAAAVRRHLEGCAGCRAERDRLAAAVAALRALPSAPDPSPSFTARLEARLAAERRPRSWLERLSGSGWGPGALRWKIAAPVAAAAIAASVVLFAVRAHRAEEREIARHLDLLLDYEVVASLGDVETADDAALVAVLDELEGPEGRP